MAINTCGKIDGRAALQGSVVWDDFVHEVEIVGLSVRAQQLLIRFINCANRASLHPRDWRRYYGFVRYAHAHRARSTVSDIYVALLTSGFTEQKAQQLANVYGHGREILRASTPVFRDGRVYD